MRKHADRLSHPALKQLLRQIDDEIVRCLDNYPHRTDELLEAALYSIGSGGHRWRPVLFLRIWEKLDNHKQQFSVLPLACAIECLHTATLLFDDLPCMDDGLIRRGKKTCHLEFTEARTILTACWLCDVAQHYIHRFHATQPSSGAQDLEDLFRATKNRLMQGQIRDLEQKAISEKGIIETYRLKSGVFYSLVASIPARILGLQKLAVHLERFGNFLGIAYQISDDIADQTTTAARLGKDVHKDDSKGTLPKRYGIKRAIALRKVYFKKAVIELKHLASPVDDLIELTERIVWMD